MHLGELSEIKDVNKKGRGIELKLELIQELRNKNKISLKKKHLIERSYLLFFKL